MIRLPPRSPRRPRAAPFFFNDPAPTEIYTLSLHAALPIYPGNDEYLSPAHPENYFLAAGAAIKEKVIIAGADHTFASGSRRSEEHTFELQSQSNLVCRLLLEKKKKTNTEAN